MKSRSGEQFLEAIRARAFVKSSATRRIIRTRSNGGVAEDSWLFDFRAVLLDPVWLNTFAELFWQTYENTGPFQVCGLETTGIPLVAAIVMKGVERGTPVNGFFIRKSRKREGLMKAIEGTLTREPVILVDDLINSGNTIARQAAILGDAGVTIRDAFIVLAFRSNESYDDLLGRGKKIRALYTLADFGLPLLSTAASEMPRTVFETVWRFSAPGAAFEHVVPKSAPLLDDTRVYFGADNGNFYALEQATGNIVWTFSIGKHPVGKSILSSPALHNGIVYFGAYDGTVYALDADTGVVRWMYNDADWVGSSPALAVTLGLLFIGLEFGLWKKRGGIIALDLKTGEKRWEDRTSQLTHCSPLYIPEEKMVVIGSNDGAVYAYDASTGERQWVYRTRGEVKSSLAYDTKRKLVIFGSFDTSCYALHARTGTPAFAFQTGASIYSTPLVSGDVVYVASLDKHVYALDLNTGKEKFSFVTSGRIFASPVLVEDSLIIGSNDGKMYALDPDTGALRGFFQCTERIVNKVAYNAQSNLFFVPTVANDLYCIRAKIEPPTQIK